MGSPSKWLLPMAILSSILGFLSGCGRNYDLFKIVAKNFAYEIKNPIHPPAAKLTIPPRSNPGIHASYVGHSTIFLSLYGTYILTDPNFSHRIKISRRVVESPILPKEIKELDIVLITHAHFDHLDIPSLKELPKGALLVIPTGCRDLVEGLGFSTVVELGWNDTISQNGISIRAFAPAHWGRRSPWDDRERGYNSYLITKNSHSILLAGDTGYSKSFETVGKGGRISVAFFPITAYEPEWFRRNHANPEEAIQMFKESGAEFMVPIHWGTFILSHESLDEPLNRLKAEAKRLRMEDRVIILRHGEMFTVPD